MILILSKNKTNLPEIKRAAISKQFFKFQREEKFSPAYKMLSLTFPDFFKQTAGELTFKIYFVKGFIPTTTLANDE